jgi:hypothetical protein
MQLQPDLVLAEPLVGQPRPVEGVFAFFDVLLGGAALVIEAHHPVGFHLQVGDDDTLAGEQFARMPFDLGNHSARDLPGLRLIVEIDEKPLDLGQRGPPHGPRQPMRDLLSQDVAGGQSDGIEIASLFKARIDRRDRLGGVGAEEPQDVVRGIPADDGGEGIPPSGSTVDVALAQGAAFQPAELVEQEIWVIAGAVEVPVPDSTFLIAVRRAVPTLSISSTIYLSPLRS